MFVHRTSRPSSGFSLIELMAVTAITAVVVAAVAVGHREYRRHVFVTDALASIQMVREVAQGLDTTRPLDPAQLAERMPPEHRRTVKPGVFEAVSGRGKVLETLPRPQGGFSVVYPAVDSAICQSIVVAGWAVMDGLTVQASLSPEDAVIGGLTPVAVRIAELGPDQAPPPAWLLEQACRQWHRVDLVVSFVDGFPGAGGAVKPPEFEPPEIPGPKPPPVELF